MSHCVIFSFELFIVHWNFCNHFRIMKKKNENRRRATRLCTINAHTQKEEIYRVFFCIIRVQKAQARFVVNVRYTFSLLVDYIIQTSLSSSNRSLTSFVYLRWILLFVLNYFSLALYSRTLLTHTTPSFFYFI